MDPDTQIGPVTHAPQFGPVLSVIRFRDEGEAIDRANDTGHGLAAGDWTGDQGRMFRAANRVMPGP